ncbi:LapA family protein [Mycobacterium bourgelatii]|nr:LapA family protein [Mycobacterium bourgelatii]
MSRNVIEPRPYADEPKADSLVEAQRAPGLVAVVGAVLAFVVSLANFALGQVGVGIAAGIGGFLVFAGGLAWLLLERRRIRDAERERLMTELAQRASWVS